MRGWRVPLLLLLMLRGVAVADPMKADFPAILRRTLVHEGGWYDGSKPSDPNPTMRGVTQATYDRWRTKRNLPTQTVRNIMDVELESIYRSYWNAVQGDLYGPQTAELMFDHAVNAGPVAAIRALQRSLGVQDDGVLGPVTRAAVAWAEDGPLAARLGYERLADYCRIARNPLKRPNLLEWVTRTLPAATEAAADCLGKPGPDSDGAAADG